MNNPVHSSAVLSEDGLYRYRLLRVWGDAPRLVFVMLNPSTADASNDDPTIRRCMGFARRDRFGGVEVVNLYAFRATDPKALRSAADPVGPDNDTHLRWTAAAAELGKSKCVAAWGANAEPSRAAAVRDLFDTYGGLHHLGLTKAGQPRHPLYLPGAAPMTRWAS